MGALRFRLFGFPVEVQLGFWVLALLIGLRPGRPWTEAALWLGILFVSILVHELGHAFAARAYGQSPSIVLHLMGGITSWSATHDLGKKRRILVTLAGPGAGFALGLTAYGALLLASKVLGSAPKGAPWVEALALLAFANVFWSVINLLPVLPFDGGQVLATALGPERRKLAATVSLVFGLVTAAVLLRLGSLLGAFLFGMGGVSHFLSAVKEAQPPRGPVRPARELLAEARQALETGDRARVSSCASAVLETSDDPAEHGAALELLVWSALASGDTPAARHIVRWNRDALDRYVQAAVAEADGNLEHAVGLLTALREQGDRRVEVAAMLVRLWLKTGKIRAAAELTLELAELVPDEDLARVAEETARAGELELAARLREELGRRARA